MKKQVKSSVDKKDLKVLSKDEARKLKGGNTASTQEQTTSEIVIEDILQI